MLLNENQTPPPKPVRTSEFIEILQSPDLEAADKLFAEVETDKLFAEVEAEEESVQVSKTDSNQSVPKSVLVSTLTRRRNSSTQEEDNDDEWGDLPQNTNQVVLNESPGQNVITSNNITPLSNEIEKEHNAHQEQLQVNNKYSQQKQSQIYENPPTEVFLIFLFKDF